MSENFTFVDFNGKNVSLPPLTDKAKALFDEYNHFFVYEYLSGNYLNYCFIFFNNEVYVSSNDIGLAITTDSEDSYVALFYHDRFEEYSVSRRGYPLNLSDDPRRHTTVVYCSDSLLDYKDIFSTYDFHLDLSEQISEYTLRPIVEEQNISPFDVFGETFGILPLLMVVFVGYIGIRKSIKYLFGLLRNS